MTSISTNAMVPLSESDALLLNGKDLLLMHGAVLKDAELKKQHEIDLLKIGIHISADVNFGFHNLAAVPQAPETTCSTLSKLLLEKCWSRNIAIKNVGR